MRLALLLKMAYCVGRIKKLSQESKQMRTENQILTNNYSYRFLDTAYEEVSWKVLYMCVQMPDICYTGSIDRRLSLCHVHHD